MTGEFESEAVPEYTKYNPSTNYTGYYDANSFIGNHTYFGGVDYESSRPNNYRLDLKPTLMDTLTQDMTQTDYSSDLKLQFFDGPQSNTNPDIYGKTVTDVKSVTMTDLIEQINPADPNNVTAYNRVYLASIDDYSDLDNDPNQITVVDWCLFACKSKTIGAPLVNNRYVVVTEYVQKQGGVELQNYTNPVALSAMVDMDTKLVTFYENNDYTTQVAIYPMKDVVIFFGGSGTGLLPRVVMQLGEDLNVELLKVPEPTYMDPSYGVELA